MVDNIEQFIVFFKSDKRPIGLPQLVENDIDVDAALECMPAEACYHGVYVKSQLLKIGFVESDFEED